MADYVSLSKVMKILRELKDYNDEPILKSHYREALIDKAILDDDLYLENHTKEIK